MEAPDKIYLEWYRIGDKKYRHWVITPKTNNEDVEYIRKDVFIEKVVNFLEILGYAYTITDNITKSLYDNTQLIEDFKKYMED